MSEKLCKWQQVDRAIRQLIVSGEWPPGSRLPTYDQLELQFQVSRITLQQVVRNLKKDGFVRSRERLGLFVSEQPPHLNRVGIVIPRDENEVRFWQELIRVTRSVTAELGMELKVYRDMDHSQASEEALNYDVTNLMLAGLLFPYPLFDGRPGLAAIANSPIPKALPVTSIRMKNALLYELDEQSLVRRALDYLDSKGCSRVALFANIGLSMLSLYDAEVANHPFSAPEVWRFAVPLQSLELASKIAHLIMALPESERPDGIFISDDNLALPVLNGLAATGVRIPEDLAIVSHFNWSTMNQEPLPIECLGFDLRSMVHEILKAFELCRTTGDLAESLKVPPVFENELS